MAKKPTRLRFTEDDLTDKIRSHAAARERNADGNKEMGIKVCFVKAAQGFDVRLADDPVFVTDKLIIAVPEYRKGGIAVKTVCCGE